MVSKIAAWGCISIEKFTSAGRASLKDGKIYGVPYAWGAIPFMLSEGQIPHPAQLRFAGALGSRAQAGACFVVDDKSAALLLPRVLNGDMNIYELSGLNRSQRAQAKSSANSGPNIRKLLGDCGGELMDLYKSGEVWISNTLGRISVVALAAEGIRCSSSFIPERRPPKAGMDSNMIVTGTPK